MKKSLIALAVMAASGASMAQVTLYGVADVWVGSSKDAIAGDGIRQTVVQSGGLSSNRFGFKGSEDLGGGLKANFLLEQGFKIDDGSATASTAFSRQSYVGLSGSMGEIKVGRIWTAFDDIAGATNSVFDSALSATNNVFLTTGYNGNPNNGVHYTMPEVAGINGAISYSFGENATAATSDSNVLAANLTYSAGPLGLGVAFQREDSGVSNDEVEFTRLNASYDLGAAKLLASYGLLDDVADDAKTNEYQIGADVPLSAALTLSAGYAYSKTKVAGVSESEASGFGAAVGYSMSKRTTAYAGLQRAEEKDLVGNTKAKSSVYAVGVKHTF